MFFVFCFVFFFLFSDVLMDMLSNSRLAAVGRFLNGDLGGADEGSFGVRSILAEKATQEFWDNPILGIGIGEFRFGEYVYPHNQHLEIFAELGVFFGIAHLLFVFSSFVVASRVNKAIILLFAVAASFSGDASYLRFLYSFCLLGFLGRGSISKIQASSV
ncbi:O-antigen ligase family protein [Cupriavidus basilensis]